MSQAQTQSAIRRQVIKMCLTAVAMFAFVFVVMVPLYNLFCEVTGLNGKTGGPYQAKQIVVDETRTITVQMLAVNNEQMPWDFKPEMQEIEVHPGESIQVNYLVTNPTSQAMVAQAVPSVTPFRASSYFHKTECFCFTQQPLEAGGEMAMPLVFIVDPELPENVHKITLSYTLFDVTDIASEQAISSL